jgi:hypothetical protein
MLPQQDLSPRYWAAFDAQLMFKGLQPDVLGTGDSRDSSFRSVLVKSGLAKGCRALDIGAGGFVGHTTTRHMLDVLEAQVDAVEIDAALCAKLTERFGNRVNVICKSIDDFDPGDTRYDLIALDLPMIPYEFEELIPRFLPRLNDGGYVVCDFPYDIDATFGGSQPLFDPSYRPEWEAFMLRKFGAIEIDPRTAQRAYHGSELTVRAILDKWSALTKRRGFGWIVLQKGRPVREQGMMERIVQRLRG